MDNQEASLTGYLLLFSGELITLVLMAIPVIGAFVRKHQSQWAILGFALLLATFEIWHLLDNNPAEWPMIGWVAMFIWAFSPARKSN